MARGISILTQYQATETIPTRHPFTSFASRWALLCTCAAVGGVGCIGSSKPEQPEAEAPQSAPQGLEQPAAARSVDSAAAAEIARAFVTGVLDTANIHVVKYERADTGHVFWLSRRLPAELGQGDGGCIVLVDPTMKSRRIVGPRRDGICSL